MVNYSMTQEILDESDVLKRIKEFLSDANTGLRRGKEVPEHIVEDLTILARKWEFSDLGVLACRGLVRNGLKGQLCVKSTWQWKRSADFFGGGHLVNGQTWCFRAEMMRDGAHAPPIAGISGIKKQGARSVVMGYHDEERDHYYADVHQGDIIYYYGTALPREVGDNEPSNIKDPVTYRTRRITKNSKGKGPTHATEGLFTSYWTGQTVRVFRSFRLAHIVPYRPLTGFRCDGLYIVTLPELIKRERQIYRFRMTEEQGLLRHSNPPLQPEYRQQQQKRKREE